MTLAGLLIPIVVLYLPSPRINSDKLDPGRVDRVSGTCGQLSPGQDYTRHSVASGFHGGAGGDGRGPTASGTSIGSRKRRDAIFALS